MRLNNVKLVLFKEILDTLRDRRTLFIMTILPILLYPVLMISTLMITQMQMSKLASEKSVFIVVGSENAPGLLERLKEKNTEDQADADTEDSDSEPFKDPMTQATPGGAAAKGAAVSMLENIQFRLEDRFREDFRRELLDKDVSLILVIPENFEELLRTGDEEAVAELSVEIYYDANNDKSGFLKDAVASRLKIFQNDILKTKLDAADIPTSLLEKRLSFTDVGSEKALIKGELGLFMSRFLAFMLVTMSLTGALYPAIDLSAGEKERGTMETLLISPASRMELVFGKFLTVFIISLVTALLNLGSMALTVLAIPMVMGPGVSQALSLETNLLIFVYMMMVLVPLVALFSALSLAVSTFARSFKEGQNYLNPLMMAAFLPSMATMLPGFEMTTTLCFVPVLSAALLFRELFSNNFEWTNVVLTFSSTMIYSLLAIQWTVSLFEREDVLFRESEEINWTFWIRKGLKRAVPSGFEAMFVYVIVVVLFFFASTRISPDKLLQGQLMLHYFIVLGVPLLMVRLYNVEWTSTLHLRLVSLKQIVLSLPFMVCALVVARLVLALQMSTDTSPASNPGNQQMEKLFTDLINNHFLMAFFVIAITPAITEEILCRGLLLSSLKKNLGSWRGVLVSAILFGLLHMNPEQLVNAVVLGTALAILVLRTGSLLPAMLLHVINNGSALILSREDVSLPQVMDPLLWLIAPGMDTDVVPSQSALIISLAIAIVAAIISYRLIPKRKG